MNRGKKTVWRVGARRAAGVVPAVLLILTACPKDETLGPTSSVVVAPDQSEITFVGDTTFATAASLDGGKHLRPGDAALWGTTAAGIVSVDGIGTDAQGRQRARIIAQKLGQVTITATVGGAAGTTGSAPVRVTGFPSVAASFTFSCGHPAGRHLECWGANDIGQYGSGAASSTTGFTPTRVAGNRRLTVVAASFSSNHACGLTAAGKAYCWGSNGSGELGTAAAVGTCSGLPCATSPTPVDGGLTFKAISVGNQFVCALTNDGTAYCWGNNAAGQLGDSSTSNRPVPTLVKTDKKFTAVSAGPSHVCALGTDQRVYCWGDNLLGKLGDGTTAARSAPTLAASGATYSDISAGYSFTCGIETTGKARCWGDNGVGQLTGTVGTSSPVPVDVPTLAVNQRSISSGLYSTCTLDAGGAATCWGWDLWGNLGRGSIPSATLPPGPVTGANRWRVLDVGYVHVCGIAADDDLTYCWGYNLYSNTGVNTGGANFATPTLVTAQ